MLLSILVRVVAKTGLETVTNLKHEIPAVWP